MPYNISIYIYVYVYIYIHIYVPTHNLQLVFRSPGQRLPQVVSRQVAGSTATATHLVSLVSSMQGSS